MNDTLQNLKDFLTVLEKYFPYSTMGEDFKGKHNFTLGDDGNMVLCLWFNEMFYLVALDSNDFIYIEESIKALKDSLDKHIGE